jgi:hypothetical protein
VIQEKAKGQQAGRESVVPTDGAEVRIVDEEQKQQQGAEED